MKRTGAVIFHSPAGDSDVERIVATARTFAMLDLAEAVGPRVSTGVLVGELPREAREHVRSWETLVLPPEEPFHLGHLLKTIIRHHQLDSLLYFGSGSGALLAASDLDQLVRFGQRDRPGALFNNFYSCDFAAFSDTSVLLDLALPEGDNGLGFLLSDAGVPCYALPRTLETQFDLDTPVDVLLVKAADRGGERLRSHLASLDLDHPTLAPVAETLVERSALVYLVGRVSPATWHAFETQVACRTAGIIEGRSMKAYGHTRVPMLNRAFRDRGFQELFGWLEQAADAAIIDSRPLLVRDGVLPAPRERFCSDLFRVSALRDPRWVDFTRCAMECGIPILLGGHSLVSGGLSLLSDICWKGRNLPRRLHPQPVEGEENPA